jgi:hypothetical protein
MRIIQLITLSFSLLLVDKVLAQGTKISVFKNQNESVDLVVYNSPVNCRKNFAVDIAFSSGLHNTNEWLVWTLNYKDCNQAVKQLQMSTPIGKECNRSNEFLSILQSGASSQINGEHTTIEPRSDFSDVDVILGISDVRLVKSYQAPSATQNSSVTQSPLVSVPISAPIVNPTVSNNVDGPITLTSLSFSVPIFSNPDLKSKSGDLPSSTKLKLLGYVPQRESDGFFKVEQSGEVFYVHRCHVICDANYYRGVK